MFKKIILPLIMICLFAGIADAVCYKPCRKPNCQYIVSSLTGGGITALDGVEGDCLIDGDQGIVITKESDSTYPKRQFFYTLDADSGLAESLPGVITPDSNPGTKRWIKTDLPSGPAGATTEVGLESQLTDVSNILTNNDTTFNPSANLNFDSDTLYIDVTNNRIGIGTITPANILTLQGSTSITSAVADSGNTGTTTMTAGSLFTGGKDSNFIVEIDGVNLVATVNNIVDDTTVTSADDGTYYGINTTGGSGAGLTLTVIIRGGSIIAVYPYNYVNGYLVGETVTLSDLSQRGCDSCNDDGTVDIATLYSNTYKWSDDGGVTWEAVNQNISGTGALPLNDVATVTFSATSGADLGDFWTFTGTVDNPFLVEDESGNDLITVLNDGTFEVGATTTPGGTLNVISPDPGHQRAVNAYIEDTGDTNKITGGLFIARRSNSVNVSGNETVGIGAQAQFHGSANTDSGSGFVAGRFTAQTKVTTGTPTLSGLQGLEAVGIEDLSTGGTLYIDNVTDITAAGIGLTAYTTVDSFTGLKVASAGANAGVINKEVGISIDERLYGATKYGLVLEGEDNSIVMGANDEVLIDHDSLSNALEINLSGSSNMAILGGKLGVGIATPNSPFEVSVNQGAGNDGIRMSDADDNNEYRLRAWVGGSGNAQFELYDVNQTAVWKLNTQAGADNYYNGGGKLGIGTITPAATLQVIASGPNDKQAINANIEDTGNTQKVIGIFSIATRSNAVSSNLKTYGLNAFGRYNGTANVTSEIFGGRYVGNLIGTSGTPTINVIGGITSEGLEDVSSGGTLTVTDAYDFRAEGSGLTSHTTVGTYYGLKVQDGSVNNGVINTKIGVSIDPMTFGTVDYGLVMEGDDNSVAMGSGKEVLIDYDSVTGDFEINLSGSTNMTVLGGNLGVGITPARALHISDVMRLEPRASAPTSPAAGDIYFDSNNGDLCSYDGTAWDDLTTGTSPGNCA